MTGAHPLVTREYGVGDNYGEVRECSLMIIISLRVTCVKVA